VSVKGRVQKREQEVFQKRACELKAKTDDDEESKKIKRAEVEKHLGRLRIHDIREGRCSLMVALLFK
jgi:hypothetical protein